MKYALIKIGYQRFITMIDVAPEMFRALGALLPIETEVRNGRYVYRKLDDLNLEMSLIDEKDIEKEGSNVQRDGNYEN